MAMMPTFAASAMALWVIMKHYHDLKSLQSNMDTTRQIRRATPMTPPDERPSVRLHRLVNGYQVSQAIHVAATLGIADLLRDGSRSAADLNRRKGVRWGKNFCRSTEPLLDSFRCVRKPPFRRFLSKYATTHLHRAWHSPILLGLVGGILCK